MKTIEKLEKKLLAKLKEKYPEKPDPMNIPIVIKRAAKNYKTIRVATGMHIGDYDEEV